MDLVVYSQYYRTRTPERQLEIDACLRRNLNHPGISRMVLFTESDAPPVPQGTVPVEVVRIDERITYAEWFRWVQRQGAGIGLLLNADIYLDEGLEHLAASFNGPDTFLALTRYNPGHAGFHLNDYPHWTQDVWGVRADAELPESLLYASSFPLGFPGCDNRIAYVMWSHGFRVRNPCYHVRSVHLQASTARHYNKTGDRLYGGVSYVHPSLAPDEDAELEFTLWTRSTQRPAGVLVNQQAIEQGVHQLRHSEAEVAQRFLDLQQFTGLSWVHEAVGSAHLQGELHTFASEDTVFLPMPRMLEQGVELQLPRPTRLEGLTLRLPQRAPAGYRLELEAQGEGEAQLQLQSDAALALKAGGERRFWQPAELKGTPWQRLRLTLQGPAADPAWREEEGAELVLFGETGALQQAKSLNVIAEEKGETQPARLLRAVRFAAPGSIEPKNLTVQEGAIKGATGSTSGDGLTGSDEASALKYAYNSYPTNETGAYTASLVLKAGTQTRIVLRINDQSGVNDARQVFDLARGCREGDAVNGGSATRASSRIQALGGGWYRCSISAVFHEPLACLHAPAVWLEHYAPTSSTGTLYSGEAQVLQGVEGSAAPDPAEQPAAAPPAPPLDPAGNADAPYRWLRRRDCQAQLESAEEFHTYGNRFRVLRSGDALLFDDRFWPSIGVSPIEAVPCGLEDAKGLLLWGFGQPALVHRPGFIANTKRFSEDVNFWQYPCRTEGDAFAVHQSLVGPQLKDGVLQLYLGLPWATWIDRSAWPQSTIKATTDRINKLRLALQAEGVRLKVHSVCQHIFWREHLHMVKASGVNCLWLSHKPMNENEAEGMSLMPWHLYAVNVLEEDRRQGLSIKPLQHKKYLASFIGAHMDHYISDVRTRLDRFDELRDWHIRLNNEWHFNTIVYGQQAENNFILKTRDANSYALNESVKSYNEILSDSIFSLCPAGAGPNSLRLWESLAIGSIPVILSDNLVLPEIPKWALSGRTQSWQDIVILHPESDLDTLEERLRSIDIEEIENRTHACIDVAKAFQRATCLGLLASASRAQNVDLQSTESETARRTLYGNRTQPDLASAKSTIRYWKPQQIHRGLTFSKYTGIDTREQLKLTSPPHASSDSTIVHLDQCELVTGIQVTSKAPVSFKICVEVSSGHNKFRDIMEEYLDRDKIAPSSTIRLSIPNRGLWTDCLRFSVSSVSDDTAASQLEVGLAVEIQENAFPTCIQEIDKQGVLNYASATNASRHDQILSTSNIQSAQVIQDLMALKSTMPPEFANTRVYPSISKPTSNLLDETIRSGITMYVHLMNRNENIVKNLANWLSLDFDELILLDWSTKGGITHLPKILEDPRVRIVRVENQTKFIRTLAQNLASRVARFDKIFKCDSDVELKGDFFGSHPLSRGEFWVGEWKQARDFNERHLHGETYYWLEDFLRVGGYDERIKSYGHDDTNFTDRLVLSGLRKKVFNYDLMHHQEHAQTVRAEGSHGLHPMVATYANRFMTTYTPLWGPSSKGSEFILLDQENNGRHLRFELIRQPEEQTNDGHISEALRKVGSWYISPERIDEMADEDINSIIWRYQLE